MIGSKAAQSFRLCEVLRRFSTFRSFCAGNGFNLKSKYICSFFDIFSKTATNSASVYPNSTQTITCIVPIWKTSGSASRTVINANISVWLADASGSAAGVIPFTGAVQTRNFDRCGNTIKDGDETDTDCGGSCSQKCTTGGKCKVDSDCSTLSCYSSVCTSKFVAQSIPEYHYSHFSVYRCAEVCILHSNVH